MTKGRKKISVSKFQIPGECKNYGDILILMYLPGLDLGVRTGPHYVSEKKWLP